MICTAELINRLLNPPHDEEKKADAAAYLSGVSDDVLTVLCHRFPYLSREVITALWDQGLVLLMEELSDD